MHIEPALSLISEMEGGQRTRRCLCVCVQARVQACVQARMVLDVCVIRM